jgi:hypothetical protein
MSQNACASRRCRKLLAMTLTTYILAAILGWTRIHGQAKDPADLAWLTSIADDIASVSLEEEPLFKNDSERVKTALLLASVARYESDFAPWVDAGLCNSREWRVSNTAIHHGATCDGGHAFSLWQIHAGARGVDLLADRRAAIREAISRLRVSLDAGRGLCWYTGETGDCPKAELRLRTALVWEKGHPFKTATFAGVD